MERRTVATTLFKVTSDQGESYIGARDIGEALEYFSYVTVTKLEQVASGVPICIVEETKRTSA